MKHDIRKSTFKAISGWRGDSLCCPQAFGGDIYAGCGMGCWWCFCREMEEEMYTKYYTGWSRDLVRRSDPEEFKRLFDQAYGSDKPTTNWTIKCLRYGLPFNMGSKSDPFQFPNDPLVVEVLKLFKEYKVPIIFETKSIYAGLEVYLDIIKQLNAAIIVAIMGGSDTLNYKLEPGSPPASSRWGMVGDLNKAGVWTAVRWEPIMPTINASDDDLEGYAKNAAKYGAKHVSLYHYRSSNFYRAKEEFEARGFNFIRMLEHSTDEHWGPIGTKFFKILQELKVPASSPDFVNFPFENSCISCCGTDSIFKPYMFNFQYALHLIKTKGHVCWDDMEAVDFKEPESYKRMKECWNGGGQIYILKDCVGVKVMDIDGHGKYIYGRPEGPIEQELKQGSLL